MSDKTFFKPTSLYKEYMILDLIEKNSHITQREMSSHVGISLAMINLFLNEYESSGLIKRHKHNSKTVDYVLTKKGIERKRFLNIGYLANSQKLFNDAKSNIELFMIEIEKKGFSKIILYGAGEVSELILQSLSNNNLSIEILAVVDDDKNKTDSLILNKKIIPLNLIFNHNFDAILISSYTNRDLMRSKLLNINLEPSKIISFFEI